MSRAPTKKYKEYQVRYVTYQDLPLCCPTPEMTLWDMHPRVYLPIEKTGKATCPYCSVQYVLQSKK